MSGVLVVTEQRGGAWNRMSFETLAAGQQLAAKLATECSAVILAAGSSSLLPELRSKKLKKIFSVEHDLLADYTADGYVASLEQLIQREQPAFVLFPHTYQVRDYGPALATRFQQVLISDVIGFRGAGEGESPVFVRQLMQGKLNADYRHAASGPCFVSIQAGTFRGDTVESGDTPTETFTPELAADQIRTKPGEVFRESSQTVDLSVAPIIVSVGRGIGEQDHLPVVEELAHALGAELAASRPICDNGWLPMDRQVGSSGQTVSPKLYIAVGISGAIQHLVGMKGSKAVLAINKDENAPIFEIADYGAVGDLFEVVPELTKAVRAAKS
jgi:electron transfer flavoprotein alpha subunit